MKEETREKQTRVWWEKRENSEKEDKEKRVGVEKSAARKKSRWRQERRGVIEVG